MAADHTILFWRWRGAAINLTEIKKKQEGPNSFGGGGIFSYHFRFSLFLLLLAALHMQFKELNRHFWQSQVGSLFLAGDLMRICLLERAF